MEFEALVNEKVSQTLEAKFDEILGKNVESSINRIIEDLLGPYGEMTKELKKAIQTRLQISFENVKIESYSDKVVKIVESQLDQFIDEKMLSSISNKIKSTYSRLEKQEWKLSEIIERFVKQEFPDDETYFEPTIFVEKTNYNSTHVALDKESGKDKYNCEFQFSFNTKTGGVYSYDIRGFFGSTKGADGSLKKSIHGDFDNLIFALYAGGATVVVDNYETEFYRE